MPGLDDELPTTEELDNQNIDELDEGGSPRNTELEKVVQTIAGVTQQSAQTNQQLATLLANPRIRAVLEAEGRGEEIVITPKGQVAPKEEALVIPENIDELPNSAVIPVMTKIMERIVNKSVGAAMGQVQEKLGQYDGYIQQNEQQSAKTQIEATKAKYSDFTDYSKQILELNQQNPGLSAEQLYLLAKAQSGGFDKKNPSSERPTSGGRPQGQRRLPAGPRTPVTKLQGFRDALSASLANADLAGFK